MTTPPPTSNSQTPIAAKVVEEHGLTPDEWDRAKRIAGREPTFTELGVFSAMWNEHCSYKSSRVHLRRLPSKGPKVLVGPGENAGVVDIGDGLAVCFKMESHNHPSFIEPHQGAATGVGGILRDIFTMGARPIASLNSLRFGPPTHPKTRHLVSGAVAGIGGYGNCMGVPTVGGELSFHESYSGNCLVNAMTLGLVEADAIFLGRAVGAGNPVIYVGSATGRDGIHGATMASDTFDETVAKRRPTVQIGDPFTEKRLLEACLELFERGLVLGIQDMGAAGLTCSTFEMASRAGTGIDLDLDDVPLRVASMSAYEILLSESQERMLLVCRPGNVGDVVEIFSRWDLECAVVGHVTDSGRIRVTHRGEQVVDLPARPLSDEAPVYERPLARPADFETRWEIPVAAATSADPVADLLALVASPNLSSRRWVWQQYDSMVRLGTRVGPGGDAALIRVLGTEKALALTVDVNSRFVWLDPRSGAALAVCEGVRNLACVGATPIGLTDCLNFGSPKKPEVMWTFAEAISGIAEAALALEVPVISGNVSLYNETDDAGAELASRRILPTPTCSVVGLRTGMTDDSESPRSSFAGPGDIVAVLGDPRGRTLGGGEFLYARHGLTAGKPPEARFEAELAVSAACASLVQKDLVRSAHDVSDGGLFVALAECTACHYEERFGASIVLTATEESPTLALFGEGGARIVVSYPAEAADAVVAEVARFGAKVTPIGTTGGETLTVQVGATDYQADVDALFEAWDHGLERALRVGRYA